MNKDLLAIFEYLEREKGIKRGVVIQAIEDSVRAAARKSVKGLGEQVRVEINPKTGELEIFTQKKIVETVSSPEEISLEEAKDMEPECQLGQWIEIAIVPEDLGRIAAQAARQIIGQKLKGAERDVIYEEYRDRKGDLVSGTIKRFIRGRTMVVDLGKVEAILPERNYPKIERYNPGERVQALLLDVRDTDSGGAEVILTRSHPEFVKELFIQEVPELHDKTVAIEKIARDPGYRTKIAVRSYDSKVDPVGTCVGVRGARIKNIIRELNNEKIDIVPYADDPVQLLQNLISPVEIKKLKVTNDRIWMVVADDEYPIVIGKRGMNARLIGRMLDRELDVQKISEYQKILHIQMTEFSEDPRPIFDQPLEIDGYSSLIMGSLSGAGYHTFRDFMKENPAAFTEKVPGVNYYDLAERIWNKIKQQKG